ncbi:unnamed protein product [Lactuca virosa]|uniref:Xylanase inhibitor N-terminal domain-containing protein n=1 Tax=Lactuca virosa TaxID=75947 RepID=A0AAU9MYY2_9ASTR|nr:unnamed protein product [Lactuca virosa]
MRRAPFIKCREQRFHQECQIHDTGMTSFSPTFLLVHPILILFYLIQIIGDSKPSNASASIVFGCSTSQTGDLTKPDRVIDGIFGFGQQGLSVIAQLSSQGIAPDAFSHCLVGNGGGGGILVLGQIIEPTMVYTPLIQSQLRWNYQ